MLRHSIDCEPGFTRKKMGRYWAYFDQKGERITDREVIDRLNAVGLPPLTQMLGSAPTPTAISRPPASMPAGASNIAITPTFAPTPRRASSPACASSARRFPSFAAASRSTSTSAS